MIEAGNTELYERRLLDKVPENLKNNIERPGNEREKNLWLSVLESVEEVKEDYDLGVNRYEFTRSLIKTRASFVSLNLYLGEEIWQTLKPSEEEERKYEEIGDGLLESARLTSKYLRKEIRKKENVVVAVEDLLAKSLERRALIQSLQERSGLLLNLELPRVEKEKELLVTPVPVEVLRTKEEIDPLDIENWEESIDETKIPEEVRGKYSSIIKKLEQLTEFPEMEGESISTLVVASVFHDAYDLLVTLNTREKNKFFNSQTYAEFVAENFTEGLIGKFNPESSNYRTRHYDQYTDALGSFLSILSGKYPKEQSQEIQKMPEKSNQEKQEELRPGIINHFAYRRTQFDGAQETYILWIDSKGGYFEEVGADGKRITLLFKKSFGSSSEAEDWFEERKRLFEKDVKGKINYEYDLHFEQNKEGRFELVKMPSEEKEGTSS